MGTEETGEIEQRRREELRRYTEEGQYPCGWEAPNGFVPLGFGQAPYRSAAVDALKDTGDKMIV